jgi:hypothetical protein
MTIMEPEVFVRAIFDWPEFWANIRIWWKLLGDPRGYSPSKMEKWLRDPALIGIEESHDWLTIMATQRLWQIMTDKYPLHPFWPTSIKLKISDISEEQLSNLRKIAKIYPTMYPQNQPISK